MRIYVAPVEPRFVSPCWGVTGSSDVGPVPSPEPQPARHSITTQTTWTRFHPRVFIHNFSLTVVLLAVNGLRRWCRGRHNDQIHANMSPVLMVRIC
jgi:hypothetical protein